MRVRRILVGSSLFLAAAPASASVPIVFFNWDSAVIVPPAAVILDSLARQALEGGYGRLRLTGHAGRSGPADYNLRLSRRRALAVATISLGAAFRPRR